MTYFIKQDDRALYYLPNIGRKRVYRQSIGLESNGMKLLTYKRKEYAQNICDEINEVYNDTFKVTSL